MNKTLKVKTKELILRLCYLKCRSTKMKEHSIIG